MGESAAARGSRDIAGYDRNDGVISQFAQRPSRCAILRLRAFHTGGSAMVHPLVRQLRFTRNEFRRAFAGVSDADGRRRFPPMNCLAWNVGHMAWQEQRYWLWRGQGRMLRQAIQDEFAYGAPGTTPALDDMAAAWTEI